MLRVGNMLLVCILWYVGIESHPNALSRYAASMAAPYPWGFIHLDLDG